MQTPIIRISDLLEHVNPTVLILDIEGAEVDLLPDRLPAGLRLIMVELHTPDIGDEATASVVNTIMSQGFTLKHLRAQTWAFER
ncbi:FkbM family methyltransferase [Halopseudomonas bauzanensis]|uniref:FkbM family methyltransferase n=1 Tax=Halopseudomonas bauzanensis TaxID=653930 RepID=A0A4U0YJ18_9GAMM|nr:FkbM family methyltransferase [Halopseudomonas bauzanensis]TKA89684.1 FkbM family methyltransferase [Halopseudomonas bauzanensis]